MKPMEQVKKTNHSVLKAAGAVSAMQLVPDTVK